MITAVAQSTVEQQETAITWTAILAVIGNMIAVFGGIALLGKYIKRWIRRTALDVVTPVRHTANRADKLARENRDRISILNGRIDAVWAKIGSD